MMHFWIQVSIVLAVTLNITWANTSINSEWKALHDIFDAGLYDKRIRPAGSNGTGPVVVTVNIYVRLFKDLSEKTTTFKTQLTLRQVWLDDRLKFSNDSLKYLTITNFDLLWYPDLFIANELAGHTHSLLKPNKLVRIFPNGTVLYSTRISLEVSAPMDLKNYPLDNQAVSIVLASYGYTTKDVVFMWKQSDPVQITKNLHLKEFQLTEFFTDYCTSKTNTGEYSCLRLDFLLSREFSLHFVRSFMPIMFLVILSWITFWLHPQSTVIRLAVWFTVFLAMISVLEHVPRLSFITAMDVWMGTCAVFIFCVLLELCLVNKALVEEVLKPPSNELAMKEIELENNEKDVQCTSNEHSRPPNYKAAPLRWLNRYSTKAQRIDVISRILFPAAFIFFNFIYWITYRQN